MNKHKSIRPEWACVAQYSAIKDGSSWLGHNERNLKSILFSVPLLQCGASASPRSLQTSQWYLENGWFCPAWSSTTAASSSGPRTAWPSASERVLEVREGKKSCSEEGKNLAAPPSCRDQSEVKKGNNSATVSVQF